MEPIFAHSLALADLSDRKGIDNIMVDRNYNKTYALKYDRSGTFSLVPESYAGIRNLVKLKDVVYDDLGQEYNDQVILFEFNHAKTHFNLDPLIYFGTNVVKNADEVNQQGTIYAITDESKMNFPPLNSMRGFLLYITPNTQWVFNNVEMGYRVSMDSQSWMSWFPLQRLKPILDLQINSLTVISNKRGFVRKIHDSGNAFVSWLPPIRCTKLTQIPVSEFVTEKRTQKNIIGITDRKLKLFNRSQTTIFWASTLGF